MSAEDWQDTISAACAEVGISASKCEALLLALEGTELAQAKAELSALSRASGEAVAWGEIRKMKGGELAIFTASYNVIMAKFTSGGSDGLKDGTKLYLAAPTAPGMCLDEITSEMENAGMKEAKYQYNLPVTRASVCAIFKAMLRAAAKGRAAT